MKDLRKLGIKVEQKPVRTDIYIDKRRINALNFEILKTDNDISCIDDKYDFYIDNIKIEVMNIREIAYLMDKENFERFCELWKEFHGER